MTLMFSGQYGKLWVRCSDPKCSRWFHPSGGGMTEDAAKRQEKVTCFLCSNVDSESPAERTITEVFFENDLQGPPKLQIDPTLDVHHVSDMSRGGHLVSAGARVYFDDERAAE